jgi:hypothetical protein
MLRTYYQQLTDICRSKECKHLYGSLHMCIIPSKKTISMYDFT